MWIHRVGWMQLDCPSAAACRLETEQCATDRQGEGGSGEGSKCCCTQRQALQGHGGRAGRPEPTTVKAQAVFGTNKLADVAAR